MGILYLAGMFTITFILTVGGYILQRDKYWKRIWENMGKPDVKSIKELKTYIKRQSRPVASSKLEQNYVASKKR